jgi:hypothetical protein
LAEIRLAWKLGFIDATGKEVVPCKFDKVFSFNKEGVAIVISGET